MVASPHLTHTALTDDELRATLEVFNFVEEFSFGLDLDPIIDRLRARYLHFNDARIAAPVESVDPIAYQTRPATHRAAFYQPL